MTTQENPEPQPQDAVLAGSAGEGAPLNEPAPLTAAEAGGHQPGAETTEEPQAVEEPKKPAERTYTQAEWSARESAKDKEIAGYRRDIQTREQDAQRQKEVAAEQQARTVDARAVDDGEITQQEAVHRQQRREQTVSEQQAFGQLQQTNREMAANLEARGRVIAAMDFAEEFGVDMQALLDDESSLTDFNLMRSKARELQLDKREANQPGTESFDTSQRSRTAGVAIDSMTGQEKILWALEHPPKTRS